MHQFPTSFQFSNSLLTLIADHVYSCRFGTFLCNSEFERTRLCLQSRTVSIWTCISYSFVPTCLKFLSLSLDVNVNANQFTNPFYDEKDKQILFISTSPQSVVLWEEFFLRFHPPFASSKNTTLPPFSSYTINLDLITSSASPIRNATNADDKVRGSIAFLSKASLNVYPLNSNDSYGWSPMVLSVSHPLCVFLSYSIADCIRRCLRKGHAS